MLKNEFLLTKDKYGYIAWHWAAVKGSLEALQSLWIWAKEVAIDPNELLPAKTVNKLTAFQLAAYGNQEKELLNLCVWAEKAQLNPNVLKNN
jgi:ankyrin repeat protein